MSDSDRRMSAAICFALVFRKRSLSSSWDSIRTNPVHTLPERNHTKPHPRLFWLSGVFGVAPTKSFRQTYSFHEHPRVSGESAIRAVRSTGAQGRAGGDPRGVHHGPRAAA